MHSSSEAVSDDDGSAMGSEPAKSIQPVGFGPGIHGAGWFVENYDRGFSQESTGESDALPFTNTKIGASSEPFP